MFYIYNNNITSHNKFMDQSYNNITSDNSLIALSGDNKFKIVQYYQ